MSLGEFVISFEEKGVRKYAGPYTILEEAKKAFEDYVKQYQKVKINRLMYSPYNPMFY